MNPNYKYFNPRSRVGNDYVGWIPLQYTNDFNPRSRVGNDNKNIRGVYIVITFQSTFPRGERL